MNGSGSIVADLWQEDDVNSGTRAGEYAEALYGRMSGMPRTTKKGAASEPVLIFR